jgi:cytochrome oxidase Cu insertion factor (SCO1/SenC/PrrC family)
MKMMKEYVEGKHEKWIAWEHIISAKIEEVVALANAIGHGTDSETKGEI